MADGGLRRDPPRASAPVREMDDPRAADLQALIEPILADHDMELVELTCRSHGRQQLVRLLVETVGGVTIQQCAQINRLISNALDDVKLIEGSYTIEVSSPGLDRPLVSKRDFERVLGEDLLVDMNVGDSHVKELQGMLLAVQQEAIVLKMISGNVTVPLADIRTAKKALRW